jgi:superfamily II DNA or RNA helicase
MSALRKHQSEMIAIIDGIIAGSGIKDIIIKATPGAGKSSLPLIAGKLITAGLADAICWICPRMSLQDQAERNFIDPFFRELLKHRLLIRASTNENDPCRGMNGFVTTYQAIGVDKDQTVLTDFRRKRYILVLDEYHHAEAEDGSWTKALLPLYEKAVYRVLMSGTLSRGDGKKLAFTPYVETAGGSVPSLEGNKETAIIEYTRADALAEQAILPLSFMFAEGSAQWKRKSGKIVESKLSEAQGENACHALYTALHTEYATELLTYAVNHWTAHRNTINRHAKLLVVAASIKYAKQYVTYLKNVGVNARIATSDDGPDAIKTIKAYKSNKVDILVSVNICYEGLDVPAISHIACLTNIRSYEWILQMAARAVRIDPNGGPYEKQCAYVFAPSDQMFVEIKSQIEKEQIPFIEDKRSNSRNAGAEDGGFRLEPAPGGIIPLSSAMTGKREMLLSTGIPAAEKTSSEIEAELRGKIDDHIKAYCRQNRFKHQTINYEVLMAMGKRRQDMTIKELKSCLSHVEQKYPLTFLRGTGRRVPSKAQPFPCVWR